MKNKDYIIKFGSRKSVYITKSKSDNVLQHWEKEDHKYIAKVKKPNGRYRYFYSEEEYKRYLENQKVGSNSESGNILDKISSVFEDILVKPLSSVGDLVTKSVSSFQKAASDALNKTISEVSNTVSNVSKGVSNLIDYFIFGKTDKHKSSKKPHKYIAKIDLPNGKTRYFYKQEEYDRYIYHQKYQKSEPDFMKNIPEIFDSNNPDEDPDNKDSYFMSINDPENGEISRYYESKRNGDKKYSTNCRLCTIAFELQQRGYDVRASYMDSKDIDRHNLTNFYEGLKGVYKDPITQEYFDVMKPQDSIIPSGIRKLFYNEPANLEEFIKKASPPNSRGDISVQWKGGGAHSMAYEIDSNGKVTIYDGQISKKYETSEDIAKLSDRTRSSNIALTRTDNLELKEEILKYVEY